MRRPVVSRRQMLTGAAALVGATVTRPARGHDTTPRLQAGEDDVVARLRGASASLLADALGRLGHDPRRYAMSGRGIRPMWPVAGTIIGPAITTRYEPTGRRSTLDDIRRHVFDPVDRAAAGSVWVTSCGTDEVLSMFGDIIVLACRQRGLSGLVTDGGCRDLETLEAIGVPIFARGACLYGPGAAVQAVASDVPITCGAAAVSPGDLIAADTDGVLVIPRSLAGEVARLRPELERHEDETRRLIEQGGSLRASYLVGG